MSAIDELDGVDDPVTDWVATDPAERGVTGDRVRTVNPPPDSGGEADTRS